MAIGDIITAARYNNLQSRVATILGTGSGDDGYGQALNSNQVGVSTNIIDASVMALSDGMVWKLMNDGANHASI